MSEICEKNGYGMGSASSGERGERKREITYFHVFKQIFVWHLFHYNV